jgi:phage gpG-like protein
MKADLLADILNDMRVELYDEFDQNFVRGGFFSQAWKEKLTGDPSRLQLSGKLRRSIRARTQKSAVVFSSSEPYAEIHNEGGEIEITPKMRRFFWAKYYENGKTGATAEMYKNLALKKVGDKIKIPKRQFIGDAPEVRKAVESIINDNMQRHVKNIADNFNKK